MDLKQYIRDIPDFPKKGILFRDITTLLQNRDALKGTIDMLTDHYQNKAIDQILGIESRGFIFGAPLACRLGTGFIPVRKPGKLPHDKEQVEYQLEYGTDRLEIHKDALKPGQRVLIIDDLLATGGTAAAVGQLVKKLDAEVAGFGFVIELSFLNGRDKLKGYDIHALVQY